MHIRYANLSTCAAATGVVVVIDVIRAYTTAAFALAAGARRVLLTSQVGEALALRSRFPGALVMGEVDGLQPPEFDYGNSPAALACLNLAGQTLIQRTSAGTQGATRARSAEVLLGGCFATAAATVRAIRGQCPAEVTLVATGVRPDDPGDEDLACADYLAALLRDEQPNPTIYLERVRRSAAAQKFYDPAQPAFPAADMDCCLAHDRFDFALSIARREDLLVLTPMVQRA